MSCKERLNSNRRVTLVGIGGHGKVVLDSLLSCNNANQEINLLDEVPFSDLIFNRYQVNKFNLAELLEYDYCHISIGDNKIREKYFLSLSANGNKFYTISHSSANVSRHAILGEACFIASGAIIAHSTTIGNGVIVNHNAVIDHDCSIGSFVHIAPNTTIGGGVRIGEAALIGAGAIIMPFITVGNNSVIGAGAVVTKDVRPNSIMLGIPAKEMRIEI